MFRWTKRENYSKKKGEREIERQKKTIRKRERE